MIQKHDIDAESKALLTDGHKEILQSKCYEDYGNPSYIIYMITTVHEDSLTILRNMHKY